MILILTLGLATYYDFMLYKTTVIPYLNWDAPDLVIPFFLRYIMFLVQICLTIKIYRQKTQDKEALNNAEGATEAHLLLADNCHYYYLFF